MALITKINHISLIDMNYWNIFNVEKYQCAEEMSVISMSCQAQLTYLSIPGSDVTASQSGGDGQGKEIFSSRHSVT